MKAQLLLNWEPLPHFLLSQAWLRSVPVVNVGLVVLPSLQPQLISSGQISPDRNRSKNLKILHAVVFTLVFKNIILNYTALKPVIYPSMRHIIITPKMEREKILKTKIKSRILFKMPLSFTAELVFWS